MWLFSFLSGPRLADADAELKAELRDFSYDGLIQLSIDLETGTVKRGTWDGCVLSYRRGYAGSVDCDRRGRRGNAFTRFWDAERVADGHVLEVLMQEIHERTPSGTPVELPEPVLIP